MLLLQVLTEQEVQVIIQTTLLVLQVHIPLHQIIQAVTVHHRIQVAVVHRIQVVVAVPEAVAPVAVAEDHVQAVEAVAEDKL